MNLAHIRLEDIKKPKEEKIAAAEVVETTTPVEEIAETVKPQKKYRVVKYLEEEAAEND